MIRIPTSRVLWSIAGVAAFVALLAVGAAGWLPAACDRAMTSAALDAAGAAGLRVGPPSATSSSPGAGATDEGDATSRTNLEGDEVSPALATYGIDPSGNLFEVHSPQTEVPRLAGPTT